MRVLVCGSRHFNDYKLLKETLDAYSIDVLIEGEARGADTLARRYGESSNIPVLKFPADWVRYGRRAGPIRNGEMLREGKPDLCVAFRGRNSRGTQNMIDQSKKAGVEVIVVDISSTMPLESLRKAVDAFK